MTDVATLLAEFVDELHGGGLPEVAPFIERAGDLESRKELAKAIEGVLAFSPSSARHPRDAASGEFVDAAFKANIEKIVDKALANVDSMKAVKGAAGGWQIDFPRWRAALGFSQAELAERTLSAGGWEASETQVSVAQRWIAAIEAGTRDASEVSRNALAALAEALRIPRDALIGSGGAPGASDAALAFRSSDKDTDSASKEQIAERLDAIAEFFDGAMGEYQRPPLSDVDEWFAGDRSDSSTPPS
ncbi:MAG: hypothetical protein WAP35_02140 [Solirubrobacterales bacterium]